MPNYHDLTIAKHNIFFAELAKHGLVATAARTAEIDRSHAYKLRDADPEFAERWLEALDLYADGLEKAAHQRAVDGLVKPVLHQGNLTFLYKLGPDGRPLKDDDGHYILDLDEEGKPKFLHTREYSDSLLALMLKAKRKREYDAANKIELTGADGGALKVEQSPTEIARSIAFALALGLRAKEQQAAAEPTDGSDLA